MEIVSFLSSTLADPRVSFVGGAIISLVVGYVFYAKAQTRRCIHYSVESTSLVRVNKALPKKFQITSNGKSIPNLARTTVDIWNGGNTALRSSDFANEKKIEVYLGHEDILDYGLVKSTEGMSIPVVSMSNNSKIIFIDLDYMNKNSGFKIEFYHVSNYPDIEVTCPIIDGQNKPKRQMPSAPRNQFSFIPGRRKYGIISEILVLSILAVTAGAATRYGLAMRHSLDMSGVSIDASFLGILRYVSTTFLLLLIAGGFVFWFMNFVFLGRSAPIELNDSNQSN